MSPLSIAAIIPTYNYPHGINQAIASALNQTLPPVETIVVDDGSTDGTRNILDAYGSRIKYLYQQNRGASAARNAGVLAANCEWVAFSVKAPERVAHGKSSDTARKVKTRTLERHKGAAPTCTPSSHKG